MAAKLISKTLALVADAVALGRLLVDVPDADEIRTELHRPYFTRRWHPFTKSSFWISSDGTTAVCLTLSGLDMDETIAVWLCFDEHRRLPGFTLSAGALSKIIELEIGLRVEIAS